MNTFRRFLQDNNQEWYDSNLFKINKSYSRLMPMSEPRDAQDLPEDISLPFKKCIVSFKKSYLYLVDDCSYTIDCLAFEELNPTQIVVAALTRMYDGVYERYKTVYLGYVNGKAAMSSGLETFYYGDETIRNMIKSTHEVIDQVILDLCSRKYVYVENNEKIDVKFRDKATRKLNRVKYTPKMIIYISDKKTFKNEHPELSGRVISKPQHAFECMGHWRKLHNPDHLGKNREGEYLVEGFTWVIPHIRCADRGEVLKKVRVIQ